LQGVPGHSSEQKRPGRRRIGRCRIALFAVVAVAAGWILYCGYRFEIVFPAPVVRHGGAPEDSVRFEAVVRPSLAMDWLEDRAGLDGGARFLASFLPPREIGVLLKPAPDAMVLVLYANSRRLTPLIAHVLNQGRILPDLPCLSWDAMGFHVARRGLVAAHAIIESDEAFQASFEDYREVTPVPAPTGEAALIEVTLDNRDGRALAALMTLHAAVDGPPFYTPRELARSLESIARIDAKADLVEDALVGQGRFVAVGGTGVPAVFQEHGQDAHATLDAAMRELAYLVEVVRDELRPVLRDNWGLALFVDIRREEADIICEFRLEGITQALERMWGIEP